MEALLRELAGYAGAADPAGLAAEISLLMEGAYVTRQVAGNPDTGRIARRIAEGILERHLPPVDRGRVS